MNEFQRSLAVVIGINQYQKGIHPLKTAKPDAVKFARLLKRTYEYTLVHPTLGKRPILDKDASLKKLRSLLEVTLPNKIKPTKDDRLLFYFAGHGIALNGEQGPEGYLIPSDADLNDYNSLLSMRELHDRLAALECRHLLVILDCCFAGTFRWASTRKLIPIPQTIHWEHYHRFIKYPAWQVLTSASYNQEALDFLHQDNRGTGESGCHSPFAEALFEGLQEQKADLIEDGVITAPELYLYLRDYVELRSKELQTPGLWPLKKHDRGEFIFKFPHTEPQLEHAPELKEENNPYRGLKAFDEEHARFFFGRQELIQRLFTQVSRPQQQFTVVLGISGSGKSSLVKAGLIPHLRKYELNLIQAAYLTLGILKVIPSFPVRLLPINYVHQWHILETMRPGGNPFKELVRTFSSLDPEKITFEKLKDKPHELVDRVNQWSDKKDNHKRKLLLIIDQFEELITQAPKVVSSSEDKKETWLDKVKIILKFDNQEDSQSESEKAQLEWQQFLDFLVNIIKNCSQLSIIVTLRSDFEPGFAESVLKPYWNRFIVRPMRPDELREVVEAPATEMALYFEPANLVDRLVDEVNQMPGALPLLSFTLSELYIKLYEEWKGDIKTDRTLTVDQEFGKQGGVAGSLTRRANEEYELIAKLNIKSKRLIFRGLFYNISPIFPLVSVFLFEHEIHELSQVTMRRVMLRMVNIERGEAVRRRVLKPELDYPSDDENERVEAVLNCLINARLIVTGKDIESGEIFYEPAHDFLVTGWYKLQDWIKEEQEKLALQKSLTPAAQAWKARQGRGDLWTNNSRLSRIDEIRIFDNHWLNKLETEFVNKSIRQRRFNQFLIVLIVGAITVAALVANDQRIKAERRLYISIAQRLSNEASRQSTEPGALMARQAYIFNSQYQGNVQSQIDNALRQVLSVDYFNFIQKGHRNGFLTAAFSPYNSNLLVSGSNNKDRNLILWNLQSSNLEKTFLEGHSNGVTDLVFSSDQKWLASASYDGTIRLWNLMDSGTKPKILQGQNDGILSVALSSDNQWLASGGRDKTARLWKLDNLDPVEVTLDNSGIEENLLTVAFSSDSEWLAAGSENGVVLLWRLQPCPNKPVVLKASKETNWSDHQVTSLAFSPDRQWLISFEVYFVRLWNLQNLDAEPITLSLDNYGGYSSGAMAISRDGQWLATGRDEIKLWNLESRTPQAVPFKENETNPNKLANWVNSLEFSLDGKWLASGRQGGRVELWRLPPDGKSSVILQGYQDDGVTSVTFSADSQWLAAGRTDGILRIWDLKGSEVNPLLLEKRDKKGTSVAFSSDGQWLAVGGNEGDLWNLQTDPPELTPMEIRPTEPSFGTYTETMIFSPDDNNWLVSGGDAVRLWKLPSPTADFLPCPVIYEEGNIRQPLWIHSIAFEPKGKWFFTGIDDGSIGIWDIQNLNCNPYLWNGHKGPVYSIAVSPDSQKIVSIGGTTIKWWQRKEGSTIPTFIEEKQEERNNISSGTFSQDGKWFAAGADDGTVYLWNLETPNQKPTPLAGHERGVTSVAFSRDKDNPWLASGSEDGTLRLWNPQSPDNLPIVLSTYGKEVSAVAFSSDDQKVAASSADGTVYIWYAKTKKLADLVCEKVKRNLTSDEWDLFVGEDIPYKSTCPNFPSGEDIYPESHTK